MSSISSKVPWFETTHLNPLSFGAGQLGTAEAALTDGLQGVAGFEERHGFVFTANSGTPNNKGGCISVRQGLMLRWLPEALLVDV